jgi:hypothetical protein
VFKGPDSALIHLQSQLERHRCFVILAVSSEQLRELRFYVMLKIVSFVLLVQLLDQDRAPGLHVHRQILGEIRELPLQCDRNASGQDCAVRVTRV